MKIIDLTLPLYTGMPVYPGTPEASIERAFTFDKTGWNMARLQINSHDGTHVNTPIHGAQEGKNLDDYTLDSFIGPAKIFNDDIKLTHGEGVIFRDKNIDRENLSWILKERPHFIGLSSDYEIDEEIEKELLKEDVVVFERLANADELPNEFMFYGVPLKIRDGDGSPVRAFAVVED